MNYLDAPQRQQILTGVLAAHTPEQLITASRQLDTWVAIHPDDKGIRWAYEQMALVELALQETASACNVLPELTTTAS